MTSIKFRELIIKPQEVIELELENLVKRCENDVVNIKKYADPEHYPEGITLIVSDYLLWAKKFEQYVSAEYWESAMYQLQQMAVGLCCEYKPKHQAEHV